MQDYLDFNLKKGVTEGRLYLRELVETTELLAHTLACFK